MVASLPSSSVQSSGRRSTREDCVSSSTSKYGHSSHNFNAPNVESLTYIQDESDANRAHYALEHYQHRGQFWNASKHATCVRYALMAGIGIVQACVAYFTNITSIFFITQKYDHASSILKEAALSDYKWLLIFKAYLSFAAIQLFFGALAALFVWIEPVAAGSGIPEVKIYLNGMDLPRVVDPQTLVCKVLGVIASVSAGLPVGKEGPMIHSGAVVANVLSSGQVRDDLQKRDMVTCGAAAGVCTAFSSPIGGILFAMEEGASYWAPSLTWKTFWSSMIALVTLYCLNTVGSMFGKVGFNKLFSFGNFVFEEESSFAVFELALFVLIGIFGGIIGAIFNDTNEGITKWRMKNVNHSKQRRVLEVLCVSLLVSTAAFLMPLLWSGNCKPLPSIDETSISQVELRESLVPFLCKDGIEYNEMASLIFAEPGDAIRQLFHLKTHVFSNAALLCFFLVYISLAVITYGIAVPSGLFVPSLLSGAAFGRLFGNTAQKYYPNLAYSNTYSLVGAAAVLGGMARMTISLTVILLECIGNGQYVLPLMLTLMTARLTGGIWNSDLYHIHIHFKKGVHFLEANLHAISRHYKLCAGHVMSDDVIFVRPVEKVSVIYNVLKSSKHSNFPVVDTDDNGILYGTIGRNALCVLLKKRSYGKPVETNGDDMTSTGAPTTIIHNYISLDGTQANYLPLVQWETIEKSYPKYPSIADVRIPSEARECFVDLRPYTNTAPVSVRESSSIQRTYEIFRSLGLRFLPVVNRHNQIVGTITRSDLTPEALTEKMTDKGAKKLQ